MGERGGVLERRRSRVGKIKRVVVVVIVVFGCVRVGEVGGLKVR